MTLADSSHGLHPLASLESHVLIALDQGTSAEDLQKARGWTADDWAHAVERCVKRGWIGSDGGLSRDGNLLRENIEALTDRLAAQPFGTLDNAARAALLKAPAPAAAVVSRSGAIRYPNPIGLPPIDEGLV